MGYCPLNDSGIFFRKVFLTSPTTKIILKDFKVYRILRTHPHHCSMVAIGVQLLFDDKFGSVLICTVVPLLRDHPAVHTKVVFKEGWSFIRGRKQCKPKHVSSGIVVLSVR